MNRVTIRDAHLPPVVDEFFEDLAGCFIASLIDFFAGYDQMDIDLESRDMIAFMTSLELLRMITFLTTNSITHFVKVVNKILDEHISHRAKSFVDDVEVKGPNINYENVKIVPRIRKFVQEHIMW